MIMKRIYTLILASLALLSSCTGNKKAEENVETLRIGVMPSVDHLPLAIAQEQHYFDSLGLNVELVRFTSPMERDAALQAGELDGTISDYTTVMTQNAKGLSVKLLSSTDGLFSFIVNPKSGINTLADLKGKKVALSSNTVIEFATDQVLAKAKLEPTDITKVEVQKIPLRLEMVAKGEVDAAILPQPFAKRYGFVPSVGWGMILAGLFSNVLSPVYQLSFTLDIWSILICLIIAFFGTAFAFFISMKAVSLVSPLVVSVISASEPLSSALLSVLFLGLVVDWSILLAMALIILPMIFLSIEEAKESK